MFDRVLISHSPNWQSSIDAGLLAESLLFYKKIILLGNGVTVKDLVKAISLERAVDLVQRGLLEFHFETDMVGIAQTDPFPGPLYFGATRVSLTDFPQPDSPKARDHAREQVEKAIIEQISGGSGVRRALAADFASHAVPFSYQGFSQDDIFDELSKPATAHSLVTELLSAMIPGFRLPDPVRISVSPGIGDRPYKIEANLPLAEMQKAYRQRVPPSHSTMTMSSILANLNGASQEIYAAASLNCEIASDTLGTRLNVIRLGDSLAEQLASGESIAEFSELTLRNAQAIREAINSGRFKFAEFMDILDKAEKFRGWLHASRISDSMLSEYYEKAVEDTWADKLPGKSARWAVFTLIGAGIDALGAGGLGTLGATAVSAGDAFLLDKVIKGWKPHHFIEKELAPRLRRPLLEAALGNKRRKRKKHR